MWYARYRGPDPTHTHTHIHTHTHTPHKIHRHTWPNIFKYTCIVYFFQILFAARREKEEGVVIMDLENDTLSILYNAVVNKSPINSYLHTCLVNP